MSEIMLKTEKKRKWKIFQRYGKYYFWYHKNTYFLENAKSKEECHVFTDRKNNFLILISNKKEDFAGLIYLNKKCEVIWEKNFANVSDYWKANNKLVKQPKYFFEYTPIFQARILFLGSSFSKKISKKRPVTTCEEGISGSRLTKSQKVMNEPNEYVKDTPEDFFKDWKPFSIGFALGIIYILLGIMSFYYWNC